MIDLREYTPERRKYLFTTPACCVYLACPNLRKPCKIGSTNDIIQTHQRLVQAVWFNIYIGFLLWAPGKEIARRIESVCQAKFEHKRLAGEWFDMQVEKLGDEIYAEAKRLYPTAPCILHEGMVAYLKRRTNRRPSTRPRNVELDNLTDM